MQITWNAKTFKLPECETCGANSAVIQHACAATILLEAKNLNLRLALFSFFIVNN